MNYVAKPVAVSDASRAAYHSYLVQRRAALGLGRETFTTTMEVEMTGDPRCGASVLCEIEFYEEVKAIPGYGEQPDEPAEYAIASIRPYELREGANGFISTERHYLPAPAWLQDMLVACVNADKLGDAVERI